MSKKKREKIYIMSIKPKYAKAIYEGRKNWEFRKVPPPIGVPIFIYESAPVSAVTGRLCFSMEIKGFFAHVYIAIKNWKFYTSNNPGITVEELEEYAGDKPVSALRVFDANRIEEPIPLKCKPPMNWGRYFVPKQEAEGSAE